MHLIGFGQQGASNLAALLDFQRQIGCQSRGPCPFSGLAQMPHLLDLGDHGDVTRWAVEKTPPVGLGEGTIVLGFVAIGQGHKVGQVQQGRIAVPPGHRADAVRPDAEMPLHLVALIGIEHAPQAIQPHRATVADRLAASPLDILVVLRRSLALLGTDLTAQLLQARAHWRDRGRSRSARPPGTASNEQAPDQNQGCKSSLQGRSSREITTLPRQPCMAG